MQLEVHPPLPESQQAGLRQALALAGVRIAVTQEALNGAWFRAAVREAVDREPVVARYAPSPRSTRGATRA